MLSRLAAFVTWAAVAASVVFWGLRLFVRPAPPPEHAVLVSSAAGLNGDLARVLGAQAAAEEEPDDEAPAPVADARFRLIGVVAPRSAAARAGAVALIATDGKPPKAYRLGAPVDGDLVLQSVHARGAALGPRGQPPQVALELPALPPPSVGVPPGAQPALRPPLPGQPAMALPPAMAAPRVGPPAIAPPHDDDERPAPAPQAPQRPPV